jgi:hypothetical protein
MPLVEQHDSLSTDLGRADPPQPALPKCQFQGIVVNTQLKASVPHGINRLRVPDRAARAKPGHVHFEAWIVIVRGVS